jgi:hypothetical protein
MKLLFERGYDWVLWVDDDDPPKFNDLFEQMFKIVYDNDSHSLGMVGAVGERFDKKRAKIIRLKDKQLNGYLDVDTISGNMFTSVTTIECSRSVTCVWVVLLLLLTMSSNCCLIYDHVTISCANVTVAPTAISTTAVTTLGAAILILLFRGLACEPNCAVN